MSSQWCRCYLSAISFVFIGIPAPVVADEDVPLTVKEQEAIAALTKVGAMVNYRSTIPGSESKRAQILDANESKDFTDKHLAYVVDLPKLDSVDLRGTSVTDAGLVHLKALTYLGNLDLAYTRITNNGLAHLSGLASLNYLYLDGTPITDVGIKQLYPLKNLLNMSLSETKVSRNGSDAIKKHLPNIDHDVTKLSLYVRHGTKIPRIVERAPWIESVDLLGDDRDGDIDDSDLLQLPQIPNLLALRFVGSKVTDAGLSVLRELKSLEYLCMNSSLIRGPGLHNLHGLKQLKQIDFDGMPIDAPYIDALKRNLPNCKIVQ